VRRCQGVEHLAQRPVGDGQFNRRRRIDAAVDPNGKPLRIGDSLERGS
jgi:hypothetical protein